MLHINGTTVESVTYSDLITVDFLAVTAYDLDTPTSLLDITLSVQYVGSTARVTLYATDIYSNKNVRVIVLDLI